MRNMFILLGLVTITILTHQVIIEFQRGNTPNMIGAVAAVALLLALIYVFIPFFPKVKKKQIKHV